MRRKIFYRIEAVDYRMVSTILIRQDDHILGGEVVKRYLPQWSRDGTTWQTYTNLGFQKDGFEMLTGAEAFLARKNPQYRENFKGVLGQ